MFMEAHVHFRTCMGAAWEILTYMTVHDLRADLYGGCMEIVTQYVKAMFMNYQYEKTLVIRQHSNRIKAIKPHIGPYPKVFRGAPGSSYIFPFIRTTKFAYI